MLAPHGGRFHASTDAFANQRRLQFCHGRDNREHGPAHWAGCVNLILNANKSHAEVIEFFNLNSAVGAKQSSGKLLMLNQCLCLESSKMANPFGEAF